MMRRMKRRLGIHFSVKAALRNPDIYVRQVLRRQKSFAVVAEEALSAAGRGTVVQIGANDGVANDPLTTLFTARPELISRALLIEPQSAAFELLRARYTGVQHVVCVHAAIDWEDGERALYRLDSGQGMNLLGRKIGSGISSFNREHVVELIQPHILDQIHKEKLIATLIQPEVVPTRRLDSLLREHGIAHPTVLVVDTEGYDGEIIRMVADSGVWPSVLQYEHKHLSRRERRGVSRLLRAAGYSLFADHADVWGAMRKATTPDAGASQ